MQKVSKKEFAWLWEKYFKRFKYKCWTRTVKHKSKRGKYYVPDKYANEVKKQNIF